MNRRMLAIGVMMGLAGLNTTAAFAHVSVTGPAYEGKNSILTFGVGHGCEGKDTYKIVVQLPTQITSVRAIPSSFGEADLVKNEAGTPIAVVWTKETVREADDQYYQFSIRASIPKEPFTQLIFPVIQYCRSTDGEESIAEWIAPPSVEEGSGSGEEGPSPAAWLWIVPDRKPGWNRVVAASKITDMSVFADAQIVWVGKAAYSANADTMAQIEAEAEVTPLTSIEVGAEIWVKY